MKRFIKNIYFNGAEGSHSGLRYSTTDKSFSLNIEICECLGKSKTARLYRN